MNFLPCERCLACDHEACTEGLCNCGIIHEKDSDVMKGFKRLKAMTPEAQEVAIREALKRTRT